MLIRTMLAQHLRDAGFRVVEAANAREATDIMEAGETVDVLFTDVRMPGENDGVWLAQLVQQNYPAVRIVLASGERDVGQAIVGARLFSKPYDLDLVENHIRDLLAAAREPALWEESD